MRKAAALRSHKEPARPGGGAPAGAAPAEAARPPPSASWTVFALGAQRRPVNSSARVALQRKAETARRGSAFPLTLVGAANDPAEAEADRAADLAVRGANAAAGGSVADTQASSSGSSGNSLSSGGAGQALDKRTRRDMEGHFGADFATVRVHTGAAASASATALQAKAYTAGSDIVFNHGQYQPESSTGRRLLAHELAHVVQQGAAPMRNAAAATARLRPAPPRARRDPDLNQMLDDEFQAWSAEYTDAHSSGDHAEAAYAARMVLLLQGVDGDDFADAAALEDFFGDLYVDAESEDATLDRTGEFAELATEAFPLLWSDRVYDALLLDVDDEALAEAALAAEDRMFDTALRVPDAVGDVGLPVPYADAAALRAFPLRLVHVLLEQAHVVKDMALDTRSYAVAGWTQGFYAVWNLMAEAYADSVASGDIIVNYDDYQDFVTTRRAGLDALGQRIGSVTTEELMQGVDDDTTAITQLAFVQALAAMLMGLLPAMAYWNEGTELFDIELAEVDALIAGEGGDERVYRALRWAWENGYFGDAGWQLLEGLWAEKWKILGLAALLIGVQMVPGLNVVADFALLLYAGADAVAAMASLHTAFQAVADSQRAVSLQRNAARMAASMEGDGLRVILDLLAIGSAARGIRTRADALRRTGLSEEEALRRALAEATGEEAQAIRGALARQRIRARLDPEGLLEGLFERGLNPEVAEQALLSGLQPQRIVAIAEAGGEMARVQAVIEYAGNHASPVNAMIDGGLPVARLGELMDASAGLREIGAVQALMGAGGSVARAEELIAAFATLGDVSQLGRLTTQGLLNVFEAGGTRALQTVQDTLALEASGSVVGFDAWVDFTIRRLNKTGADLRNTLGELTEAQRIVGELAPGQRLRIGNDAGSGSKTFDMVIEDAAGNAVRSIDVTSVVGRPLKTAADLTSGVRHVAGKVPHLGGGAAEATIRVDMRRSISLGAGRRKVFEPNGDWEIVEADGLVHADPGNVIAELAAHLPSVSGSGGLSAVHVVNLDGSRIGSVVNRAGTWSVAP